MQWESFTKDLTCKSYNVFKWLINKYKNDEIDERELLIALNVVCQTTQGLVPDDEWRKLYNHFTTLRSRMIEHHKDLHI